MAQCKKMLKSGERCSNQATPGTRFCKTHAQRIIFRPVEKPAGTAPPPTRPPAATETPPPKWRARAGPAGQAPTFPGLHTDERGILVGPQGLIWLPAGSNGDAAGQLNRLGRLLSFLSQAFPLPGQLRLLRQGKAGDALVFLSPAETHKPNLSVFYDTAASAARLVEGRFYVGQDNSFVQYRDDAAPHGYDVPDYETPDGQEEWLLVAHWGSRLLEAANFAETALADFCRGVSPQPSLVASPPEQVYALAPPVLYPILARYFRAHHLRYSLARLQSPQGELILFEIGPRPNAPTGRTVPNFILDYLTRLPRVALLALAHQSGNRRILLQWRHRYPLRPEHIAGAFEADDMLLLIAEPYSNLRLHPAPQFFDGDQLMDVFTPRPASLDLTPQATVGIPELELPVLLRPDYGPTPPIAALVLSAQEMAWLRQLLYRMPGDAFGAHTLCQGRKQAVLLGGSRPITGLPFGLPLRRLSDSGLFIPLRSRFVPDLPWPLLRQALEIKDEIYTFITLDYRLDLPASDFTTLSRALVADPNRARVKFKLQTAAALPELPWTAPPARLTKVETPDVLETAPISPEGDWPAGLPSIMPGSSRPAFEPASPTPDEEALDVGAYLRDQARAYEKAQDFLAAALCYDFLADTNNSGRCYRRAVGLAQTEK